MRFLLSIHDVWPGNRVLVSGYLERLRSLGAKRIALLVVPAYHGRQTMESDPEFLAWLREENARGTELFLHGYYHKMIELVPGADGSVERNRSAWGRFVNRKLVAQEAEFCGLPETAAERLLDLGLAAWERTGLARTGFVAPTWHGAPPERRMREAGLGLWETRFHLHRLSDGASRFVPALAWDLSAPDGEPRLFGGGLWLRLLTALPLIKVAIHPGDFESAGTEGVLRRVFAAGTPIAYADVFASGV
jgi:predicted deacetylase